MDDDYLAQQVAAISAAATAAEKEVGGEARSSSKPGRDVAASQSRLLKRRNFSRPKSRLLSFLLDSRHLNAAALDSRSSFGSSEARERAGGTASPSSSSCSSSSSAVSDQQRAADADMLRYLLSLTASAVDMEFRTLVNVGPEFGGGPDETKEVVLVSLLRFFDRLIECVALSISHHLSVCCVSVPAVGMIARRRVGHALLSVLFFSSIGQLLLRLRALLPGVSDGGVCRTCLSCVWSTNQVPRELSSRASVR